MNYDYKLVNVDPNTAFVKRVLLYLAVLAATIALALVVLVILFERYLLLLLPGGLLLFAFVIWFLIGRSAASYEYHFSKGSLRVEENGRPIVEFALVDLGACLSAEKADFLNKEIKKCAFLHTRFVVKNNAITGDGSLQYKICERNGTRYLLAFDTYAISLIGG